MVPGSFSVCAVALPLKRPFRWRVFVALVVLYFLGNLGGIPLLRETAMPVEPVWQWGVYTLIAAVMIALSLLMANRVGLGAPFLEGRLSKADLPKWLGSGMALTVVMLIVTLPLSVIANRGVDAASYPLSWALLPASFKAGVVEEITSRFLLISLFVWLGGRFRRDGEGRPARGVFWAAILIAGLLFGWGHVDARLGDPAATFWDYALVMVLNSSLGVTFGWLFWKLGLEWAMFAHFAYDAFVSMIVIPMVL